MQSISAGARTRIMLDELREALESAVVRYVVRVSGADAHAVVANAVQLRLRVLVANRQPVRLSDRVCESRESERERVCIGVRRCGLRAHQNSRE